MYGYHNGLVIVIARRYDEAIPKMQIGFAQLLCNSGIASYLAMTGKRFMREKKYVLIISTL